MAIGTVPVASTPAAGQPYINLSAAMQAFYARRGMWAKGEPCGMLANWLGTRAPWTNPYYVSYWTTPTGLAAMVADALDVPSQAWTTPQQRPQFLRRLRESGERAGVPAHLQLKRDRPCAVELHRPFSDLSVPAEGTKTREAFERHLMNTLREFVEYTQGSEYGG